ncbi:MAG: hemerythrin domain-containing protein [Bacteroidales bacterium]|nr:hemerythrin domain-containing protein [Bacteroidales bacterium]
MNTTDKRHTLFSPSMKLADILLSNYALLTVLPRFDIQLGFGEKSLSEICRKYNVNETFFLLVCNVYTFHEYLPDKIEISTLDIESLIGYLKRSHRYYMEDRIASIKQKLELMRSCCSGMHHDIIHSFFKEYEKEVVNHFNYEEEVVFPYIIALMKGETKVGYHIQQYEQNHSNIEDKLGDLKNIIIKYLPESCSSKERTDVLFDIFLFEEDLNKHSLIEDKILVPFVEEMEKKYEE